MNAYPWTTGFSDAEGAVGLELSMARFPSKTVMLFRSYSDTSAAAGGSAREGAFYPGASPVLSDHAITSNVDGPPYGKLLISLYDGSVQVFEKKTPFSDAPAEVVAQWRPYQ
jgi:hypothetical protein